MKKMVANTIIIFFPIILIATYIIFTPSSEDLIRANVNLIQFMLGPLIHFILSLCFIYIYLIKKIKYDMIYVVIGIILSFLIFSPDIMKLISNDLYIFLINQIQTSVYIFGMLMMSYILLIINYIKCKKDDISL